MHSSWKQACAVGLVLTIALVAVHRATRTTESFESVMAVAAKPVVEPARAEVELAHVEFAPLIPTREPRVEAAAPVEADTLPSSDAAPSSEPESELPDAPGILAFDPACPYGNKYVGMDPRALELEQKALRVEQQELAGPLLAERWSLGLYTDLSFAEYRLAVESTKVPAWNRPLRLAQTTILSDKRTPERVGVVEVYPNEVPGLQALRDEELWLGARIVELEAEWTAWLEGWLEK